MGWVDSWKERAYQFGFTVVAEIKCLGRNGENYLEGS
jgi:hypothetical protein